MRNKQINNSVKITLESRGLRTPVGTTPSGAVGYGNAPSKRLTLRASVTATGVPGGPGTAPLTYLHVRFVDAIVVSTRIYSSF